jgi:aryl-alcohol dehydrogenase-like predicted oxidoreductase
MVTPVGLGCWQFSKGKGLFGNYWGVLRDEEIELILARALAGGINWFDTAEAYGNGESEKALAKGLGKLGKSAGEVVIATKWNPILRRASSISGTIDIRLRSLFPFPIDLHQVHNPFSVSSIGAQMRAMAGLVRDGKIRYVGVSNFSRRHMERAHRALEKEGLFLVSNQVRYSLLDRKIETNGVLEAAKDLDVSIIAYSPLAQGVLTGRFHDRPDLASALTGLRKHLAAFKPGGLAKSRPVVEALRRIASKHRATATQVALNWLISRRGDTVVAIPGASRAEQADDFTAALSFRLSGEDVEELDRVSDGFK